MDLNKYDTIAAGDAGAELYLRHPATGQKLKDEAGNFLSIRVFGRDSTVFRKASFAQAERRQLMKRGVRNARITPEELEEDEIAVLAAITIRVSPNITLDGAPIEGKRIKEAYERFPWIREQLDGFINERSNFLGEDLTPSANMPEAPSDLSAP